MRKLDPNSQECRQLKAKISRKKQDINKRICEIKDNPQNLPYYPNSPMDLPRSSVQGHEGLVQDLKDSLVDDEALYQEKCGGGGGGGSAPAPVTAAGAPGSNNYPEPPTAVIVAPLVIGAGIVGTVLAPEVTVPVIGGLAGQH